MDTISDLEDAEARKFYYLEGSDVTLFVVAIGVTGVSANIYLDGNFLGMVGTYSECKGTFSVNPLYISGPYEGIESMHEAVTILKLKQQAGKKKLKIPDVRNIVNGTKANYGQSY